MSAGEWIGGRRPVCSYARISEDRQEEEAIGVSRQHANNTEAADGLKWVVVARYTDNHLTAADPDIQRPAFLQMVRDLRARQTAEGVPVRGLLAVAEDRVRRLPEDFLRVHRALTVDRDGCFYVLDEKRYIDVHADGAQVVGLVTSSTDGREVKKIGQRTARSVRDRAKEGKQSGGHRRFGWLPADKKADRPHNHLLDPVASTYLRRAIEMIMAGQSERTVTQWLIKEKVPTVKGGKWSSTTVRNMVSNPAVCGYRMLDGELVLDPETGLPVVGPWETVATPDEWRKILGRYTSYYKVDPKTLKGDPSRGTRSKRRKEVTQTRKYTLSGYLRCGRLDLSGQKCLSTMVGNPVSTRTPHGAYACNASNCQGVARRMDLVDQAITELVLKILLERYAAKEPEHREWHGQAVLDSLLERKRLLKDGYNSGQVQPADFFDMLPDLDAQVQESEKDRAEFLAEQEAGNFLAGFTSERWAEFDLRQRRVAIGTVIATVIVHPLPKGRSTRAPFDPSLLEVVYRPMT
ncbi:recombinase family protein [Streptomyces sp. H10-C2]|uniref:recombinase family protein n=1 Tax=unclassified Streptomyces TaxID=2593676 RepID=UPI0024B9C319|nr:MULTISPECIES: recombinase family protein [unclassified Streptomyces]MDJ0346165.1 recombinase family protein [Streptomyces sp. PH10-H1]MDJ0374850.1 recombinase family protein [Streptomyces sp. H10-C2]